MEFQSLFNAGLGLLSVFIGWYLRVVWSAITSLQSDVKEIERYVPTTFVRRDDYQLDIAEIKAMLIRIVDKLDNKVDK
jgi:hypothetical protein|tara:strand:- start:1291 stop:1524 length:234 start_codon:yes stop_codon:yes gene_type:complete